MKKNESVDEILASWTRCIKAGMVNSIAPSSTCVNEEVMKTALQESKMLISLFENLGKEFDDLAIHNKLAFLLTNSDGLLLKKRSFSDLNKKVNKMEIKAGMSFAEESCGTNAISLSRRLKKPVYTLPIYHYCDFLKSFYLYATPLSVNGVVIGYLAVCRLDKPIKMELMAIMELTAYKIMHEFRAKEKSPALPADRESELNAKQLEILKFLAMGLPDKTIAQKKGITLNTVKYHKKNIFKKLGVECSVQAIIKCLKLNLLSIGEIN
jgi:transcriptional regulator of acetoin/glycerol metabolism